MKKKDEYVPVNPWSGEEGRPVPVWGEERVAEAIDGAMAAFGRHRRSGFAERAGKMRAAAERLESGQEELALLMATEMGKPVAEGRGEVEKCAWVCRYYAEKAEGFLADEEVATDAGKKSVVSYRPLGPVLAVMPWNFPLWQVFRFAAPALMAGNVGLLKHAMNVQGCAAAIEEVFLAAGFEEGCFVNLPIGHEGVEQVLADERVRAATLTGSGAAGRAVAEAAGRHLKKCVLELGGSDPYLVLEDADVELAAKACAKSRLLNSGQSCIAAKRFLVHEAVHGEFLERMIALFREQVVGDPREEGTTVGPMARFDLRDELAAQVERSVEAGARCLLGGKAPDLRGAFYLPTILDGVRPGMAAFDEELFGPVAAVVTVGSEEEGITLANCSSFGLGGAVFTRDEERGERIAREEIEAGCVAVNGLVASDPRLPFGGVKESGFGRELGRFGIREFVNVKCVTSVVG
ncbi:MAG: NAD-dependent succinate-semialdehyde dehydrogenase [Verrucomicrobia bacterium]|nr:NAD-dependent succinate-semialdehyde dehydrogenase [Verrucomicrobiota bacterium]